MCASRSENTSLCQTFPFLDAYNNIHSSWMRRTSQCYALRKTEVMKRSDACEVLVSTINIFFISVSGTL